jgi:hypothetical protein
MKYALYYGMEVVVSSYQRKVFQFSFWPADPNTLNVAFVAPVYVGGNFRLV